MRYFRRAGKKFGRPARNGKNQSVKNFESKEPKTMKLSIERIGHGNREIAAK